MPYKVMIINAPVLQVLESWYDTPDFVRISLGYLAGYLRQFEGFEIKLIDAKFERKNFQQVLKEVLEFKPDLVGFTAFTNEIKPSAYLAALIKKQLPHVVTVVGGAHVTALPQQTLKEFPSFDIGAIGEGEHTFYELCEALKNFKLTGVTPEINEIAGLVHRAGGQTITNRPRERILDQDSIPFPAWDLLPQADTYFVQTVRGCPFNCVFCMNHNGKVARMRSIDNVMGELDWLLTKFAPRRISFGDELFTVDMPRTHKLMDAIIEKGIGQRLNWDIQTHVRYVDYELFAKMKQAHVARVEMGVETGDEEALRKLGKGTTLDMILKAFEAAKKAKVTTGSFLLFGQPNETVRSMKSTIDVGVKINPSIPMFGLMVPYPGTEVSRLAARNESGYKLLTTNWDEYNKQIGGAMAFANLSRTQLELFQLYGYAKVFLWNYRFLDFMKFLWQYRVGAWMVIKKIITQREFVTAKANMPPDYEEMINSPTQVTLEEIINAREEWNEVQKRELKRSRDLQKATNVAQH